jgi:hypothetical protein
MSALFAPVDERPAGLRVEHPTTVTHGGGKHTFKLEGYALVRADTYEEAQATLAFLCDAVKDNDLAPFATFVTTFYVYDELGRDVTDTLETGGPA